EGLGFVGVDLDRAGNERNAPVISRPGSRVVVRVIRTDEELMIARSIIRVLGLGRTKETLTKRK
ncbi:MAG: acetate/propionate family kinase, partial [Opitutaceae bacterium]